MIYAHGSQDYDREQTGEKVHGNVWVDTLSAQRLLPGLIEWAVEQVGVERLLYGTDSPLYFAPMQRARINCAGINHEAKYSILRGNAAKLFRLCDRDSRINFCQ